MRIGLDFDGVLRKLPFPFALFLRNHEKIKIRLIHNIMVKALVDFIPYTLNSSLINTLSPNHEYYLVSARLHAHEKVEKLIRKYTPIKKCFMRQSMKETEEEFKTRMCKENKIDLFLDDVPEVVRMLRKNGIESFIYRH